MIHIEPAECATEIGSDQDTPSKNAGRQFSSQLKDSAAVFLWPLGMLLIVAAVATLAVLL